MRRQIVAGITAGIVIFAGIGFLVFAGQQGLFGGRPKRLLMLANREAEHGQLPEAQAHLEELIGTFPESPLADDGLLALGKIYEAQDQMHEARAMYRMLLDRFPDSALVSEAQEHLGDVNIKLLFSSTSTELDGIYEVKPGDTLGEIASSYGTTVGFLKRANGLSSDIIRPGQQLKIPRGQFRIIVDKSQNRLLLTKDDEFIKSYRVATGKDNSTPVGTFKIMNKLQHPVWYRQGAIVPPDSPENILGTRWLGINKSGYGIHGSVEPDTIGKQVTAGCVRMTNSDVEELYDIVPIGTEVTILN